MQKNKFYTDQVRVIYFCPKNVYFLFFIFNIIFLWGKRGRLPPPPAHASDEKFPGSFSEVFQYIQGSFLLEWVVKYVSGVQFLETSLRLHMLQLSRFVRQTPVFVVSLPCCCCKNAKSPAKIEL